MEIKFYFAWFHTSLILVLFCGVLTSGNIDEMDADVAMNNVLPDPSASSGKDWKDTGYVMDGANQEKESRVIESEHLLEIQKKLPQFLDEGFKIAGEILEQENEAVKNNRKEGMRQYVPSHFHFRKPSEAAKRKSACRGVGLLETSKLIMKSLNLSSEDANAVLRSIPVPTTLPIMESQFCHTETKQTRQQAIVCDGNYPYRKMDGSCNNLNNAHWGAAGFPFKRYIPAQYENGDRPRGESFLPNARAVSAALKGLSPRPLSVIMTKMLMAWGQFLDHDITLTPETSAVTDSNNDGVLDHLPCCDDGNDLTPTTPDCIPIDVRTDSVYQQQGKICLRFVRSLLADSPTNFGDREQMNLVTSFVDGSNVYGSSEERGMALRSKVNGKLKENSMGEDGSCDGFQNCKFPFLPETNNGDPKDKFLAGDIRVNEQPGLTAMHTLFFRYHNILAEEYHRLFPAKDDETVYQEVRRIVGAVLQHITYNEFVPTIIGRTASNSFRIKSLKENYSSTLSWVNPSIANSFATAAYRFGHTLIEAEILGEGSAAKPLVETFFDNAFTISDPRFSLSEILSGECRAPCGRWDVHLIPTTVDQLFAEGPLFLSGLDLMAFNIMRGRDHGIPSYNDYRDFCGREIFPNFDEMLADPEMDADAVRILISQYQSPADVDLFPGALSEMHIFDGYIGETFSCILAHQFYELKFGDRFWYESSDQPRPFTVGQLGLLRNVSLASVLCDASDISMIQPFPMLNPTLRRNKPKNCDQYSDGSVATLLQNFWLE